MSAEAALNKIITDLAAIKIAIDTINFQVASGKAAADNNTLQISALLQSSKTVETLLTEIHQSSKGSPAAAADDGKATKQTLYKQLIRTYVYDANTHFPADAERLVASYRACLEKCKADALPAFDANLIAVRAAGPTNNDVINGFYNLRHTHIKDSITAFLEQNKEFIEKNPIKSSTRKPAAAGGSTPKPNDTKPIPSDVLQTISTNTAFPPNGSAAPNSTGFAFDFATNEVNVS